MKTFLSKYEHHRHTLLHNTTTDVHITSAGPLCKPTYVIKNYRTRKLNITTSSMGFMLKDWFEISEERKQTLLELRL